MNLITIVTPTYNRKDHLTKLYESLLKQSEFKFNWLIVDDGSNDLTENIVHGFTTDKFDIKYHYKSNGGKHTAINYALPKISTPLMMIVDSDDILDGPYSSIGNISIYKMNKF